MVLESQCHSHYPAVRTVIFQMKTSSTVKVNNIPEAMLFLLLANSFCDAETTFFFWILNIKSNHCKKILLLILLLPVAKHGSTEGVTLLKEWIMIVPTHSTCLRASQQKGKCFYFLCFFTLSLFLVHYSSSSVCSRVHYHSHILIFTSKVVYRQKQDNPNINLLTSSTHDT